MTITPTLDDDTEMECMILTISNTGEHKYIALLPTKGTNSEGGEVYLYRYNETKDGTPNLDNIGDDDEHEIVVEVSDEPLGTQRYDELVGEIEEEQPG